MELLTSRIFKTSILSKNRSGVSIVSWLTRKAQDSHENYGAQRFSPCDLFSCFHVCYYKIYSHVEFTVLPCTTCIYNQWNASALKWQTRSPLHIWIFLDIVTSRAGTCGGCDCADDETLPLLPKTPSVSAASPTHVMARTGMCTFTLQLTPLIHDTCIYVLYLCMYGYTDRVCSSTMYAVVNFPPAPLHRCDRKKKDHEVSQLSVISPSLIITHLSICLYDLGAVVRNTRQYSNTDKYWNVILYKVAPKTFCWPLVTIMHHLFFF